MNHITYLSVCLKDLCEHHYVESAPQPLDASALSKLSMEWKFVTSETSFKAEKLDSDR